MLKTASCNDVHNCIDQDDVCIINLGRKHNFNLLPVVKLKETEKAIQFGSIIVPRHSIWFPKKALSECKEVPGTFTLKAWFISIPGVRCSFLATCEHQCQLSTSDSSRLTNTNLIHFFVMRKIESEMVGYLQEQKLVFR